MTRIDLPPLVWSLEHLVDGEVRNEVRVDDDTRHWARVALDRMLALPGDDVSLLAAEQPGHARQVRQARELVPRPCPDDEDRGRPRTLGRVGHRAVSPTSAAGRRRAPANLESFQFRRTASQNRGATLPL